MGRDSSVTPATTEAVRNGSDAVSISDENSLCERGYQSKACAFNNLITNEAWLVNPRQAGIVNESRVLVLYTGGTIGMLKDKNGVLKPAPALLEAKIRSFPQLHDAEYAASMFVGCKRPPLVVPYTGSTIRVLYTIYEYRPLLDSSNMTMAEWIRISLDIQKYYTTFDGFVILHGTDTMSYTASALSFLLENLGKSVVLTGSQLPLLEPRSDGRENLLNALLFAGTYIIPEVTLFFNNRLLRGNRTLKYSAACLDAFRSPNMAPLATVGINVNVNWKTVMAPSSLKKFRVHPMLSEEVGILRLFPSITSEIVQAFLAPPIKGVILHTYGAGNGPTAQKGLLAAIQEASDRGVIIVNCSQCPNGHVESAYETGNALTQAGVIPGADMTPEAALAKLSYVLSKKEWSLAIKKEKMQTNLRGELTVINHTLRESKLISAIGKIMNVSSFEELEALKTAILPSILCSIAAKDDCERLEVMRQCGAYLSSYDYDYRTPLHVAVSQGNFAATKYLLKQGASVHMYDRDRRNPLDVAVAHNHYDIIDLLVRCGAHLSLLAETLAEAMNSAACRGDIRRLESFRRAGANFTEKDLSGRTIGHVAAECNQLDVFEYLFKHELYVATTDVYGHTPKDVATILGHQEIQRLIEIRTPRGEAVDDSFGGCFLNR